MPPVSPARVIATYSGEKTFGWRSNASDSGRPASTSLRTLTIVSDSGFLLGCASGTEKGGLRLEHVEGAQDRHAGAHHGGELTGHDRQVRGLDALHEGEVDLLGRVLVG